MRDPDKLPGLFFCLALFRELCFEVMMAVI